ncbi:hypothetical protein HY449_02555 [Candidatus Pacearchaeota archaeon]|nr:hypothetical protein [Candidatus Pacearchaeota archaeon]
MLVKIFGGFDLIIGVMLVFLSSFNPSAGTLIFFGVISMTKSSFGMLRDFASWIDFLAGIILGLAILVNIPSVIGIILGILVFQKGIFSFL